MTLSPVFRSSSAVETLRVRGHLDALAPSIVAERDYVQSIHALLGDVIDRRYVAAERDEQDDVRFLQEHFFLILFDSIFETLGCPPDKRALYGQLNLCVKGMVVAGDNLFDGEAKMELPLALGDGQCFASIMQLLCFDHLVMRVFETACEEPYQSRARKEADISAAAPSRAGPLPHGRGSAHRATSQIRSATHAAASGPERAARFRRTLLDSLALIGTLEGSEERGVADVLPVEEMIERVHRVRGGELFSLAFIAPRIDMAGEFDATVAARWETARAGVARLGTAFQIVDDVTDFEFDLIRRSHNVLTAQIIHDGTDSERAAFERLQHRGGAGQPTVEDEFARAARAVLRRACAEAEDGFRDLAGIGFWFPPEDAELFVRAIAGDAGDPRVDAVAGAPGSLTR